MNPQMILGVLGAWLLSLAAMGYWQNQAGHTAERTKWQARETTELRTANQKIIDLTQAARDRERAHAEHMSQVATAYEGKLQNEKRKTDALVADLFNGSLVFRDPAGQGAGAGGTGPAGPGAGQCDGAAGGELSREAAGFLLGEASRADEIVFQLSACQAVVESDRQ